MNALSIQTTRANAITSAVTTAYVKKAAHAVRSIVEDAGGDFSGLASLTVWAKVRSVLNEDPIRHVIQYHATVAARGWRGPTGDEALRRATRSAVRAIGPLLGDTASLSAARLLIDLAGSHPEHLSLAEARNVKARMGR